MLKHEELAFMKVITMLQLSPPVLLELRKTMAARKRRNALASGKAKPSEEDVGEHQSSHKPLQQSAGKRKAAELSTSVCLSPPQDNERLVCWPWRDPRLSAGTSRKPRLMECGPTYAAVVVWRAVPRQERGPLKCKAKNSRNPETVASSGVDFRRMSLREVSGPLSGTPADTTPDTAMEITRSFPQASGKTRPPSMFQASEIPVVCWYV
jgi:hypothetical protein